LGLGINAMIFLNSTDHKSVWAETFGSGKSSKFGATSSQDFWNLGGFADFDNLFLKHQAKQEKIKKPVNGL